MKDTKEKSGFLLYADWEEQVGLLTDEDAGKLFKALFAYERTRESGELPQWRRWPSRSCARSWTGTGRPTRKSARSCARMAPRAGVPGVRKRKKNQSPLQKTKRNQMVFRKTIWGVIQILLLIL